MPIDGGVIHFDQLHGKLEGGYTVEAEFGDVESFRAFVPPDWFGEELFDGDLSSKKLSKLDVLPDRLRAQPAKAAAQVAA